MKLAALLVALFSLTAVVVSAEPLAAETALAQAKITATAEHKVIFVHFAASWCIWCKRLDAFLERDEIKPIFAKYFVQLKLDVLEKPDHKALENPGADAVLQKLGGPAGLPYFAFLDAQGELIVNSRQPAAGGGENIGFPGKPEEVAWFVQMLKQAAPKISEGELETIRAALKIPVK